MKKNIDEKNLFIINFAFTFELAKDLLGISNKVKKLVPINKEKLESVTNQEKNNISLLLFWFSRLQDTLGHNLFRNLTILNRDYNRDDSIIDTLNKMEKRYIVNDAGRWDKEIRKTRNDIIHLYVPRGEKAVDIINSALYLAPELIEIVCNIHKYAQDKLDIDLSQFDTKKLKIKK